MSNYDMRRLSTMQKQERDQHWLLPFVHGEMKRTIYLFTKTADLTKEDTAAVLRSYADWLESKPARPALRLIKAEQVSA